MSGLRAGGLGFSYAGRRIFEGLDLEIASGEMLALIGPNGAGKTTLLRLLCGALRAGSGSVSIDGEPVARLSPRARARLVGVVPQETSPTFDFTVLETVLMGRTPYLGPFGLEGPGDLDAAGEALRWTGMTGFAGRLLSHLSGGERQLVFIARALAQRPRILLLDEPSAFLDIRHRLGIYELLVGLNRREGMTIVTSSHDINLAARYCRRIVLLREGSIAADGTPAEVFDPAILSEVYGTTLEVIPDPASGLPLAVPAMTPGTQRLLDV